MPKETVVDALLHVNRRWLPYTARAAELLCVMVGLAGSLRKARPIVFPAPRIHHLEVVHLGALLEALEVVMLLEAIEVVIVTYEVDG